MSTPQNLHEELAQTHDYITALEGAILHICEGLDIDPAALVEDVMTPARERELRRKVAKQGDRKTASVYDKELKSKKVYGKGGKVLKRKADFGSAANDPYRTKNMPRTFFQ